MKRTTIYVIVRHGSNAANQSMCNRAVLGIVKATSRGAARTEAERLWTFYANQSSEALPLSAANARDKRRAFEEPEPTKDELFPDGVHLVEG